MTQSNLHLILSPSTRIGKKWHVDSTPDRGYENILLATSSTGEQALLKIGDRQGSESILYADFHTYQYLHKNGCSPGIPRIHHLTKRKGRHVLVLERIYQSLRKIGQRSMLLRTTQILLWGVEILKILERIHGCGVVHGAVNMDNILLSDIEPAVGKLHLSNFGCASIHACRPHRIGKVALPRLVYDSERFFNEKVDDLEGTCAVLQGLLELVNRSKSEMKHALYAMERVSEISEHLLDMTRDEPVDYVRIRAIVLGASEFILY